MVTKSGRYINLIVNTGTCTENWFVNTESAVHKVLTITDYILEHDIDILYIAES